MARYAGAPLPHLIGGQRVPSRSGRRSRTTRRSTAGVGDVAGDAADIDARLVAHARVPRLAQPLRHRAQGDLHTVAGLIVERRHEIAVTECVDTGQTMRFMSAAALRGAVLPFLRRSGAGCCEQAVAPVGRSCQLHDSPSVGPVSVITPWNTPFMLSSEDCPGACRRCTVVHKPAEWSPYTAQLLSEIASRRVCRRCSMSCTEWASPPARRSPSTR